MLRAYKTELHPTDRQACLIRKTIGTCRFVYNLYLQTNKDAYADGRPFITGFDFAKWLNNTFIPEHPSYAWIKDASSKAVKRSIVNGEAAYKKFFKGEAGFPNFKKKSKSDVKAYYPKNNQGDLIVRRNCIKIPKLGFVRLKEKGYIPVGANVRSASVSTYAGRYYVSVLVDEPEKPKECLNSFGIGIDLGIKDLAVCSDGQVFPNINKTARIKALEKRLKREQRRLSRKYEMAKQNKKEKKGEAARYNIQKQRLKIQKLYARLLHIRTDHINQCIAKIVKTKPSYIVLEDLNIKGMLKNKHLSKALSDQKLYEFRTKLARIYNRLGIEVRIANRWYPSSKTCHACKHVHKGLKLKDRVFICPECGYQEDRDYNASLNLRDLDFYSLV